MSKKAVEDDLEDYVWGRAKELAYLQRVVSEDGLPIESILRRVQQIEDTLNRQIRKGVEENLSKLLDQAIALEELERTQRIVNSHINEISQKSETVANEFNQLVKKLEEKQEKLKESYAEYWLITDSLRCIELMETFEKRTDIVKRSEIIAEIEGILADNPGLTKVPVVKDIVGTKLKSAKNQVRTSAAEDLRRALTTLNASLVASAVKGLTNLHCLEPELDTQMSRSTAEVDRALEQLSNNSSEANKHLPSTVSLLQSHIEQWAMLGPVHLTKFCSRVSRSIRSRVPPTAPYALRFVQQMSRFLTGRRSDVSTLVDAIKPIKKEILQQGLSRVHRLVHDHVFSDGHSHTFVDILSGVLIEEETKLDWDSELKEEYASNISKVLDVVAAKLEKEINLTPETLLLGDRLLAAQQVNYRMLSVAGLLTAKWPDHSQKLRTLLSNSLEVIFNAVRSSVSAILCSMHRETLGGREISPYMHELVSYLERVGGHCAVLGPVLRVTTALGPLVDFTLNAFLEHATLVSPMSCEVRAQLCRDTAALFSACSLLHPPSQYADPRPISSLFVTDELDKLVEVPVWLRVQILISQSDSSFKRPNESVDWSVSEYVEWALEHSPKERVEFLQNLVHSYANSVVNRGETCYVPNYPIIQRILRDSVVV